LFSHFFWLAALLAFRQAGLEQYRWRSLFLASGTNNFRQFGHFFRLIRSIFVQPPRHENADDFEEKNKIGKKKEGKKMEVNYIKFECFRRKNTLRKLHFQTAIIGAV
jgi:hypothetical protein